MFGLEMSFPKVRGFIRLSHELTRIGPEWIQCNEVQLLSCGVKSNWLPYRTGMASRRDHDS